MSVTVGMAPTSDEAFSGTWSGVDGQRYLDVADFADTTSTYLRHGTQAGFLTFGFNGFSIPAGATALSVSVDFYDSEPTNGNNNSNGRIKVGGTYYDSTNHNPATGTPILRTKTWATNPKSGAAWTVDDVNGLGTSALQAFGLSSTDANPAYYVWSVQVRVTYTPPSQTLSPGGIGTAEAFGTPSVSASGGGSQTLSPGGIASAGAFGTQKVNLGLSSAGNIASAGAFGTQKLNLGLSAAGNIASAEAHGTAKLSTKLLPGGIGTAEAFGTAKCNLGINLNIGNRVI